MRIRPYNDRKEGRKKMVQSSLGIFDDKQAREAAIRGQKKAEEAAHEAWKEQAREAIYTTATTRSRFIVDDVWPNIKGDVFTHDLRAMGSLMTQAVKHGWIERTKEYRPSSRKSSHSNPRVVWKSLLFTGVML